MKNYLLTPGPTPLPPYVCEILSQPIMHHRTPQFQAILKETLDNLKYTFQTQNDAFIFASSGTGAMEAAVINTINQGDRVIVIEGGKFGERWTELAQMVGANIELAKVEWGKAVDPALIRDLLAQDSSIKAVFATHCETSTGVTTDIEALGAVVKDTPAILVVDAISSLGSVELRTDEWSLDIVVSGSQKGLMLPPGLGFLSMSKKAWQCVNACKNIRYYFDLVRGKKALDKNDTPFTPAITLIIALNEVLKRVRQEGLDAVFARNKKLAEATRKGVEALGLELFAPDAPSDAVTSVKVPEGIDGAKLVKVMRDEYGVAMAGGQAHLKGKIFRIAHMGYISADDLKKGFQTLETVLAKMGYKVATQAGSTAFASLVA